MIKCTKCGAENFDGAVSCASCGSPLQSANPFEVSPNPYGNFQASNVNPADNPYEGTGGFAAPAAAPAYPNPAHSFHTAYGSSSTFVGSWKDDSPVTTTHWVLLFGMNIIPILGNLAFLVVLIIFACGGTQKKTLVNFARAFLIIGVAAWLLSAISGGLSSMEYFLDEYMRISPTLFGIL